MIRWKLLNRRELDAFTGSEAYRRMPHLPISRHRAQSQIANPRAGAEDVLLILAFRADKLAGYLGLLPDFFRDRAGRFQVAAWMSCIWVDESQRGQGIARQLVEKALDVYEGRLLATEFTAPAKRLYDKLGSFADLTRLEGRRWYLRSALARLLPPRHPFFARMRPLLRAMDRLANAVLDLRWLFGRPGLGELRLEFVNRVDEELGAFIRAHRGGDLFRRGREELNWMLELPWILQTPQPDDCARRYAFSAQARRFVQSGVKVYGRDGRLLAFLLFTLRDGHLKLPYAYWTDDGLEAAARVVRWHWVAWRMDLFTTFQPNLVEVLSAGTRPALAQRAQGRAYLVGKSLAERLPGEFTIQEGDGDVGFT
jgi:GNAT superfamily N-acetyltransferase